MFATVEFNLNFLPSRASENHILFQNDRTFSNEIWHVVRTGDCLQSCGWEPS